MARITKHVKDPHPCHQELARDFPNLRELGLGTEATCSCGAEFVLREDQRDGRGWYAVRG